MSAHLFFLAPSDGERVGVRGRLFPRRWFYPDAPGQSVRLPKQLRKIIFYCSLPGLAAISWAAPLNFDFKDAKGVNNVIFKLEAPLEKISGSGAGLSGKVTFDPDNPGAVKGKIVLAVASLHVPNPRMKEHLHSSMWMDAGQYPEITFELVQAQGVKTDGTNTTANIAGKLTVKGVTRDVTVPVKMTFLKDKLKMRQGKEGDLLVVQATFSIQRRDFGINAAHMEDKVSDTIQLSLNLVGSAPRS